MKMFWLGFMVALTPSMIALAWLLYKERGQN